MAAFFAACAGVWTAATPAGVTGQAGSAGRSLRIWAGTGSNDLSNNPNQQPPKRSSSTSLAYCSRMPGRWPRTRRSSDGGHRWLRSAAYGAVGADSGWAGHAGHQWPAARRSSSGPTVKASATLNGRGSTTHYRISNDGLVEPGGWISACIQNRKARSRRSWQNSPVSYTHLTLPTNREV